MADRERRGIVPAEGSTFLLTIDDLDRHEIEQGLGLVESAAA